MGIHQGAKLTRFEPSAIPTLEDAIDEFLLDMGACADKTQLYYGDQVGRAFRGFFALRVRDVSEITPELVREYMRLQLAAGLGAYSIDHRYRTAKRFLNWCVEQDWIDVNPATRVKAPRMPELVRESFGTPELARLTRAAGDAPGWIPVRDRAIVVCLLGTGLRAAELLGIRIKDLDFANRLVLITGKGSKQKKIRMGRNVYKSLRDYLKVRPRVPLDALWVTQRRTAMNYSTLNAMLAALGERAGVEDCTPHRFRHTAAVAYYREHRDLRATMGLLRHSQVTTTMRYLKGLGVDYESDAGFATPDEIMNLG